jgi:hypothetical protein
MISPETACVITIESERFEDRETRSRIAFYHMFDYRGSFISLKVG